MTVPPAWTDEAGRLQAACVAPDVYPEWWNLKHPGNPQAKQICNYVCQVRDACLRAALSEQAIGVIRGGLEFKTIKDGKARVCDECSLSFIGHGNTLYCSTTCAHRGGEKAARRRRVT